MEFVTLIFLPAFVKIFLLFFMRFGKFYKRNTFIPYGKAFSDFLITVLSQPATGVYPPLSIILGKVNLYVLHPFFSKHFFFSFGGNALYISRFFLTFLDS